MGSVHVGYCGSATKRCVTFYENVLKTKAVAWMCAQRGLCDHTMLTEGDMQCSNHFKYSEQYFFTERKTISIMKLSNFIFNQTWYVTLNKSFTYAPIHFSDLKVLL